MSTQINIKKQRIRLGIVALLVVATIVLVCVGMENYANTPTYYTTSEDPTVELKRVDYKYYYLNGVELERVEIPFWQRIINGFKGFVPTLPYLLPGVLVFVLGFYLSRKLPPPLLWSDVIFGGQRKGCRKDSISLKQAPGGLIATRCWDVDKDGVLSSTAIDVKWYSAVLEADKNPLVGGWHGIYAYRLGTDIDGGADVEGIVSLSGRVVGHKDSLLRAQKCTILVLVTKKEKIAALLGQRYKCPVVVTPDIKRTIQDWVVSQEGIFWLAHNEMLLKKKLQDKFENDITKLPAYQEFQRG